MWMPLLSLTVNNETLSNNNNVNEDSSLDARQVPYEDQTKMELQMIQMGTNVKREDYQQVWFDVMYICQDYT